MIVTFPLLQLNLTDDIKDWELTVETELFFVSPYVQPDDR